MSATYQSISTYILQEVPELRDLHVSVLNEHELTDLNTLYFFMDRLAEYYVKLYQDNSENSNSIMLRIIDVIETLLVNENHGVTEMVKIGFIDNLFYLSKEKGVYNVIETLGEEGTKELRKTIQYNSIIEDFCTTLLNDIPEFQSAYETIKKEYGIGFIYLVMGQLQKCLIDSFKACSRAEEATNESGKILFLKIVTFIEQMLKHKSKVVQEFIYFGFLETLSENIHNEGCSELLSNLGPKTQKALRDIDKYGAKPGMASI